MVKVKKKNVTKTVEKKVADVLVLRHGYSIIEEATVEDIREQLDALGVEYHPQLGLKKLKILLIENE